MENQINNLDDLIFLNRNKSYGAYAHRKNYRRYMFWSVISATALFLTIVSVPLIANYVNAGAGADGPININDSLVTVGLPPKENIPAIPKRASSQPVYKAPVVVIDPDEVTEISFDPDDFKNKAITDTGSTVFVEIPEDPPIIEIEKPTTYVWVEEMPQFPGGEEARVKFLAANLKYPEMANQIGLQGTVYVYFVIDPQGKVVDVALIRGIGGGCDEEAMRVISSMPDWTPGKQNGKAVRVQHTIPISFVLH